MASECIAAAENNEPCPWRFLIAAGYAGGLAPGLAGGRPRIGRQLSPTLGLVQHPAQSVAGGTSRYMLAASARRTRCLPKRLRTNPRWRSETGALAVDMETALDRRGLRVRPGCRCSPCGLSATPPSQPFPVPGRHPLRCRAPASTLPRAARLAAGASRERSRRSWASYAGSARHGSGSHAPCSFWSAHL